MESGSGQLSLLPSVGRDMSKVFEQDRAQFTYKWKAAVSRGILQTGLRNLAKFSAENGGPYRSRLGRRHVVWRGKPGWSATVVNLTGCTARRLVPAGRRVRRPGLCATDGSIKALNIWAKRE